MEENNKVLKTIIEFTYVDPELVNQPNYKGENIKIDFYTEMDKRECKVSDEVAIINSMGQKEYNITFGDNISTEEGYKYLFAIRDFLIRQDKEKENKKSGIKDTIMKLFKSNKSKNIPEQKIKIYQCYEERK